VDTIAHALTGAVVGYCGFRQQAGRAALWASIMAAEFPDADIVLALVNSETYLRWHRTVTHSVLLMPFWAMLVAVVVWAFTRRINFRWLWFASVAAMASHLALDWITNYGTELLWPVSDERFALSWVFIVDVYVWAILALTLIAVAVTRRARTAVIGLAVVAAFVLCCGGLQWRALREARKAGSGRVEAFAQPMNPLRWTILREEGSRVHWVAGARNDTFEQCRDTKLLAKAEKTEAVKLFRWFAVFPVVEKLEGEEETTILRYRDLRFRTLMPWGGVSEGMFLVAKVKFDRYGDIVGVGLGGEDVEPVPLKVEPRGFVRTIL
jgi:membrane-bound metal-dependent hydrolase YbcI (DUF457 family)